MKLNESEISDLTPTSIKKLLKKTEQNILDLSIKKISKKKGGPKPPLPFTHNPNNMDYWEWFPFGLQNRFIIFPLPIPGPGTTVHASMGSWGNIRSISFTNSRTTFSTSRGSVAANSSGCVQILIDVLDAWSYNQTSIVPLLFFSIFNILLSNVKNGGGSPPR